MVFEILIFAWKPFYLDIYELVCNVAIDDNGF